MPPRIAIRADGSSLIGMGHVFRCLSLAQALRRAGAEAFFIGRELEGAARGVVENKGFDFESLEDELDEPTDALATLDIMRRNDAQALFIDHYGLGPTTHRFFREQAIPLGLMDDEAGNPALACDLILNQNIGVTPDAYAQSPAFVKLCGPLYALLRDEFRAAGPRREPQSETPTLLITLGGADPVNATSLALEAAVRSPSVASILVALGPAFRYRSRVAALADEDPRARLLDSPPDMAALMHQADFAVTAGGSTCYECAFVGLPNIMIQIADNQAGICAGMHEAGCSQFAGKVETLGANALTEEIHALGRDVERREEMARHGRELIDGRGADRAAAELIRIAS